MQSKPFNSTHYLWLLILCYAMLNAISNWYDARLVEIFGVVIASGALSFPFTFLLSDMITEVYGYKHARRAIWAALIFNVIFILFGQLVIHLPSPAFATDNQAFDKLLSINTRVVVSSFISYLISEPMNSFVLAKFKIITRGKYLGFRFLSSTMIATAIDSILFISIAFYGMMSFSNLLTLMFNIWLVKTSVEIIGLPFSTRLSRWLKRKEQMDIYDYNTNFSPFSLDTNYSAESNRYAVCSRSSLTKI